MRKRRPIDPLSREQKGWLTRWKTVVAPVAVYCCTSHRRSCLYVHACTCVCISASVPSESERSCTHAGAPRRPHRGLHARLSRRNELGWSLRARQVSVIGQSQWPSEFFFTTFAWISAKLFEFLTGYLFITNNNKYLFSNVV